MFLRNSFVRVRTSFYRRAAAARKTVMKCSGGLGDPPIDLAGIGFSSGAREMAARS
jgi:hypothetical protein